MVTSIDIIKPEGTGRISRGLSVSMFLYLYIPMLIFVLGWVNPVISIPVVLATAYGICLLICDGEFETNHSSLSFVESFASFAFVMLLLMFLGHGEMFAQDYDWNKHHAVVYDLANYKWPVVYEGDVLLTYYLGQYIVPAFLGKICHAPSFVINTFTLIWNSIGVWLVYTFIVEFFKIQKASGKIIVFAVMTLWGGAINLGSLIYRIPEMGLSYKGFTSATSYQWLDIEGVRVTFASNFVALRSAYQHVIPAWIGTSLFVANIRSIRSYVAIALPLAFSSTFGFIYLAVILVGMAVYRLCVEEDKKVVIKEIFSATNLLLLPMAAVIGIYLSGYLGGDKPQEFGFGFYNMLNHPWFYVIFAVSEFLLYALFLFPKYKHNVLFYLVVGQLLIIPFFRMGVWNDLCTRGGIPARFILMLMCIAVIIDTKQKQWCKAGICVIIAFSAFNIALHAIEITKTTIDYMDGKYFIQDSYGTLEGYALNSEIRIDNAYNYYTFDYHDSMFYKISRK